MSDKETAPWMVEALREMFAKGLISLDIALGHNILDLAKIVAKWHAAECTAPAPQPDAELIAIRLEGKGRREEFVSLPGYQPPEGVTVLSRIPLFAAATPQVTPAHGTYFCFECDSKNRCASAETCYAGHSGYPRRTVEGTSEQASPTTCQSPYHRPTSMFCLDCIPPDAPLGVLLLPTMRRR